VSVRRDATGAVAENGLLLIANLGRLAAQARMAGRGLIERSADLRAGGGARSAAGHDDQEASPRHSSISAPRCDVTSGQ
jgi:hypothetical protein